MALDPVPWFIGGAAEHSAEAARNIAWNATSGRTGVSTTTSLRVTALATAGGGVRIAPGGASVESTYAGATQQSYTVRNDASTTVSVPANTGSSTITRYVIVEVNDPQYAGAAPSNPVDGPYNFFRVVSSLPTVHPYVRLATLRIPPSTSVITNAMITDDRALVAPRRAEVVHARPRVSSDGGAGSQSELTAMLPGRGEWFPGGAGFSNEFTATVPTWATRMIIEPAWLSVRMNGTNSWGRFWMEYGDERNTSGKWPTSEGVDQEYEFKTQTFTWDMNETGVVYRTNWMLADNRVVPARIRGKELTFVYKAGRLSGPTRPVRLDATSGLTCRITFIEDPQGGHDDAI